MPSVQDIDLAGLPKVELHLHIEGTLEPELIFELAERNKMRLRWANVGELVSRYRFGSLQDFLDLYYDNICVLREEADFYDLTKAYLARAAADHVRHTEIFFDLQAHTSRGVALEAVLGGVTSALEAGAREHGVTSGLILSFLRDRPAEEAMELLTRVLHLGAPIIGIGLDSSELGNPPSKFRSVFEYARASGLRCVAHAGEEGPPEYVQEALDVLGVARIDHGNRSIEDEVLVERLVADEVPLTLCPLSNVMLGVVRRLADHPVANMLERGLLVTINSDDPAYFGGYIGENYRQLIGTFDLDRTTVARLAKNAVSAAFIDGTRRSGLLEEVGCWEAGERES
ncbi:MAG TPA: adenosine deaminase [Acidimicrobiales bacterium]|nr:adenosine deaminase [Acidimicrobiales bacterium]